MRILRACLPPGVVLWHFMLEPGMHATWADLLLHAAEADPRTIREEPKERPRRSSSPAQRLEQQLHAAVAKGLVG